MFPKTEGVNNFVHQILMGRGCDFCEMIADTGPPRKSFKVVRIKEIVHLPGLDFPEKSFEIARNNLCQRRFPDTRGSEQGMKSGFSDLEREVFK
jgi:hypothetical protein